MAELKEQAHLILINILTSEEGLEQHFFKNVVIEKYPELLIDISDYWLYQIYFKIMIENDTASYNKHLNFVLKFIEEHFALILDNLPSFKKWIDMLSSIPAANSALL